MIGFIKPLAKIVATIEGNNDFEIIKALLNFRELSPPKLFRLAAFFRFTQGEIALVKIQIINAGRSAAAPNSGLIDKRKIPAPSMVKMLLINCIRDCEKKRLSLSVSLLIREIRSPALF